VDGGEISPDGKHVIIAHNFGSVLIYDLESRKAHLHAFGRD